MPPAYLALVLPERAPLVSRGLGLRLRAWPSAGAGGARTYTHTPRGLRASFPKAPATETATETAGRARAVRRKLKKPRALPPGGETSERARAAPDDAESNHLDRGVERPADGGQIGSKSKK